MLHAWTIDNFLLMFSCHKTDRCGTFEDTHTYTHTHQSQHASMHTHHCIPSVAKRSSENTNAKWEDHHWARQEVKRKTFSFCCAHALLSITLMQTGTVDTFIGWHSMSKDRRNSRTRERAFLPRRERLSACESGRYKGRFTLWATEIRTCKTTSRYRS